MTAANEVRLNKEIKASPKQVFDLISRGQLMFATGILPNSLKFDFKAGGKFSFEWVSGGLCEGIFTKIEDARGVSFTWASRGCKTATGGETLVEIVLTPSKGGTMLSLTHTGFKTPESCDGHTKGWTTSVEDFARSTSFLDNLRDYAWDSFEVLMNIQSTPARLFQRWATPAGMESFFIKKMELTDAEKKPRGRTDEARAGDRFDWEWLHGSSTYGRILSIEKDKSVSFTFGSSEVTVTFTPHEAGTWLRIRQSHIPDFPEARAGLHVNCRSGWTYFASALKAVEEHGIDIRDRNPKTAGSLAVGFDIPETRKAA